MFHKLILLFILFILLTNCSTNKLSKNHGYKSLDLKYDKIIVNKTNKNDIIDLIGPPSSKSDFNSNIWFYIESRKTNQKLTRIISKKDGTFKIQEIVGCVFVKLIGRHGWKS